MKRVLLYFLLTGVLSTCVAVAQDDAVDKELTQFADSIGKQLQKTGIKKVAVFDLTDLEGSVLGLGKFIAEQTIVNLASGTNSFSVVDRTHLTTILSEHNLSISGLIQPDNVKKFGKFSGVDVIVLGTMTPLKQSVRITAKIISTETADILGAAKGQITKTDEISKLLGQITARPSTNAIVPLSVTNTVENPSTSPRIRESPPIRAVAPIEKNSKQIDELLLKIESLKMSGDQYGATLRATVIFVNRSFTNPIGIGLFSISNTHPESKIYNDRGDIFEIYHTDISGIPMAFSTQDLMEVKPDGVAETTLQYHIHWNNQGGNYSPYRFEAVVLIGDGPSGRYGNVRKLHYIIDVPTASQ
jgi:TolB-like protein